MNECLRKEEQIRARFFHCCDLRNVAEQCEIFGAELLRGATRNVVQAQRNSYRLTDGLIVRLEPGDGRFIIGGRDDQQGIDAGVLSKF